MAFKKKHKTYPRRTDNEIKSVILDLLQQFPRSTYSVSSAMNTDHRTALRHLKRLEELGKVEVVEEEHRPNLLKRHWSIKSSPQSP